MIEGIDLNVTAAAKAQLAGGENPIVGDLYGQGMSIGI